MQHRLRRADLVEDIGAVVVRGPGPLAEPADLLAGAAPADPDPEANTPDRYRTGASADLGTRHIDVLDRALRVGNVNVAADGRGDGR